VAKLPAVVYVFRSYAVLFFYLISLYTAKETQAAIAKNTIYLFLTVLA
jgi:hypothetical protein